MDQNGKLLQDGRIVWSEAPAAVVIQKPYAVALLSKHIEVTYSQLDMFVDLLWIYSSAFMVTLQVRSLRVPYPLIQTVVLRNARRLGLSNNAVVVALDNTVFCLFQVPLGAQVPSD